EARRKERASEALAHFESGCARDHAQACNRLGWMLQKSGQEDRAGAPLKKACSLREAKACNNLGWQAEKEHRPNDALTWYRQACKLGHTKACGRQAALGIKSDPG